MTTQHKASYKTEEPWLKVCVYVCVCLLCVMANVTAFALGGISC